MGDAEEIKRMARERADNYKKALEYLNGLSKLTYDDFQKMIRMAGIEMSDSEMRQTWDMSKMTLTGTEGLRQTYREVLEQGIEVFGKIDRELS